MACADYAHYIYIIYYIYSYKKSHLTSRLVPVSLEVSTLTSWLEIAWEFADSLRHRLAAAHIFQGGLCFSKPVRVYHYTNQKG